MGEAKRRRLGLGAAKYGTRKNGQPAPRLTQIILTLPNEFVQKVEALTTEINKIAGPHEALTTRGEILGVLMNIGYQETIKQIEKSESQGRLVKLPHEVEQKPPQAEQNWLRGAQARLDAIKGGKR